MPNELIYPRVTVEREEDWLRVQASVNTALGASLEARLASLPGGVDGDKAKRVRPILEAKVKQARDRMWELTKPNLRVNGFNYEDFIETTEPFDEILDRNIWALNLERVKWQTTVGEKRRHKAAEVQAVVRNLEARRELEAWKPSAEDLARAVSTPGTHILPKDIPPPPRHADVLETFNTVVADLAELSAAAPRQLERAERAYRVQEEISNMPA